MFTYMDNICYALQATTFAKLKTVPTADYTQLTTAITGTEGDH